MPAPPHDGTTLDSSNPLRFPGNASHPASKSKSLDEHFDAQQTPTAQTFNHPAFQYNASLHPLETSIAGHPSIATHRASPLSAELRVQTDLFGRSKETAAEHAPGFNKPQSPPDYRQQMGMTGSGSLPVRTSSVKSLTAAPFSGGSLSPASAVSSPGVGPLQDITPLPSPLGSTSGSWANMPLAAMAGSPPSAGSQPSPTSMSLPHSSPPKKRKAYVGLAQSMENGASTEGSRERNRSLSEYVPVSVAPRPRVTTQTPNGPDAGAKPMQREEYLAVQRGLQAGPSARPPTPPRSNQGATDSSESGSAPSSPKPVAKLPMRYDAPMIKSDSVGTWAAIRQLGTGTFSNVMLATSDLDRAHLSEDQLDPKSLVAVKICEHGPAGGADEKKIESSLKREIEILKAINHPSLVHLRACSVLDKRAFLVLNYSAGGDLFELASLKLQVLSPPLVQRIFAELVSALRYLHDQYIVHRDIKLENVLVNYSSRLLPTLDPPTHQHPIITLTDLGLGRRIPEPPASPLLNTRCGSEDYAAPELLMGQDYDGRATDAWALGVLLYAIMEGRLPFDPQPGARRQSPTSHRIARCEWSWNRLGDKDGEWDETKGAPYGEAHKIVEGLLSRARSRWSLDKVGATDWVKGGIQVEGGLRRDGWEEE